MKLKAPYCPNNGCQDEAETFRMFCTVQNCRPLPKTVNCKFCGCENRYLFRFCKQCKKCPVCERVAKRHYQEENHEV